MKNLIQSCKNSSTPCSQEAIWAERTMDDTIVVEREKIKINKNGEKEM